MKRDELIKLLTENFTADEEVTFLVNDSEYGETEEEKAKVTAFEERREKGHWECEYNGDTYSATSLMMLRSMIFKASCSTDYSISDYIDKNKKWVIDEIINYNKKFLAIG